MNDRLYQTILFALIVGLVCSMAPGMISDAHAVSTPDSVPDPSDSLEDIDLRKIFSPNPDEDLAIQFFEPLFGERWGFMLQEGLNTSSMGPLYFTRILFLLNILSLTALIMSVIYFGGVAMGTGALNEQRLSQSMSPWAVIRSPMALTAAIPMPHMGGLSFGQGIILFLLWHSIGFAGTVLDMGTQALIRQTIPSPSGEVTQDNEFVGKVTGMAATAHLLEKIGFENEIGKKRVVKRTDGSYAPAGRGSAGGQTEGGFKFYYKINELGIEEDALGFVIVPCQSIGDKICNLKVNPTLSLMQDIQNQVASNKTNQPPILDSFLYEKFPLIMNDGSGDTPGEFKLSHFDFYKNKYNKSLSQVQDPIAEKVKEQADELQEGFVEKTRKKGFLTAGAWYWAVSGIREAGNSYEKQIPVVKNAWFSQDEGNALQEESVISTEEETEKKLRKRIKNVLLQQKHQKAKQSSSGGQFLSYLTSYIIYPVWGHTVENFDEGGSNSWASFLLLGDPLSSSKIIGDGLIWGGTVGVGTSITMYYAEGAEDSIWGTVANTFTGGGASGGANILGKLAGWLSEFSFYLWIIGGYMALYIPSIPLFVWVIALFGWILLVIEAIVAFNFWVLTFTFPQGEGLGGNRAQQGFILLLDVLIRAPLMTLGFFVASIIFQATTNVIGRIFIFGSQYITDGGSLFWHPVYFFGELLFLLAIITISAHSVFGMVNHLSNGIIRWLGQQRQPLGSQKRQNKMSGFLAMGTRRTEKGANKANQMGGPGGPGGKPGGPGGKPGGPGGGMTDAMRGRGKSGGGS